MAAPCSGTRARFAVPGTTHSFWRSLNEYVSDTHHVVNCSMTRDYFRDGHAYRNVPNSEVCRWLIRRTITVRSVRWVDVECGEHATVAVAGRVRYSGVQDGGVGHLPRRQGCTTSRVWTLRVRSVHVLLPKRPHVSSSSLTFTSSDCDKQVSHWRDKGFTPWHAIWRANEGRTHNSVRGDAWRCGSAEVLRAVSWQKF